MKLYTNILCIYMIDGRVDDIIILCIVASCTEASHPDTKNPPCSIVTTFLFFIFFHIARAMIILYYSL